MTRFNSIPPLQNHLESAFCYQPLSLLLQFWLLKPPDMAGYRNDSSQMKEVLQPDSDRPEHCHKEKEMHAREDDRTDSSGQASSPSTSSSSAPPSTKAASHRQTEADKTQCTQMKDSVSSCCLLVDLKRLPQCTNVLGPLKFGKAYTVLINVRACTFSLYCSSVE